MVVECRSVADWTALLSNTALMGPHYTLLWLLDSHNSHTKFGENSSVRSKVTVVNTHKHTHDVTNISVFTN
jgi:hypothetical protein